MNKFLAFDLVDKKQHTITLNLASGWFLDYDRYAKVIFFSSSYNSNCHTIDFRSTDITKDEFEFVIFKINEFLCNNQLTYLHINTSLDVIREGILNNRAFDQFMAEMHRLYKLGEQYEPNKSN
jgi:hypothetical protein